MMCNNWK